MNANSQFTTPDPQHMPGSNDPAAVVAHVREAALSYLDRGWAVIAYPAGQKNPAGKDWPHHSLTREQATALPAETNLGILTGQASGGLYDLDLDSPRAVQAAAAWAPPTDCIHGHTSNQGSHRWYFCPDELAHATKRWEFTSARGKKSVYAELRGGTHERAFQTMAPPSTHPTGEAVVWERDGDPANVPYATLRSMAGQIAAVALAADHWPAQGSRDETAMALAGGLAHATNWSDGAIDDFVEMAAQLAGDEEHQQRRKATRARARLDEEKEVTGFPRLAALLLDGERVVKTFTTWLGLDTNDGAGPHATPRVSEAKRLLAIIKPIFDQPGNEIFRDAAGEAYATIPMRDHHRTLPIQSRAMKLWLNVMFYQAEKANPTPDALHSLMNGLEARAMYDAEARVHPVAVRVSQTAPDTLWLDLGDDTYRAVRITPEGWEVVTDPPVKFLRHKGMLPLPLPQRPAPGESLESLLRPFLNVPGQRVLYSEEGRVTEDTAWVLLVTWLCAAFFPDGPFINLLLKGPQGSGKSTVASVLQRLVDPNEVERNGEPREMRDLAIAARNSWLLPFDNVRHVQPWLSDALCRMSTGGGMRTRALYTNDEEAIFHYRRPVLLTGISDVVTEPDLLRRTVVVTLPGISSIKAEKVFWAEFEAQQPLILGALLDVINVALAELSGIEEDVASGKVALAGMADYSVRALAVEQAMGWEAGTFARAYRQVHHDAREVALEASPIFGVLESWLTRRRQQLTTAAEQAQRLGKPAPEPLTPWQGNSAALLTALNEERRAQEAERGDGARRMPAAPKGWPGSAKGMSMALAYIRQQLDEVGIQVEYRPHGRIYTVTDVRAANAAAEEDAEPSK